MKRFFAIFACCLLFVGACENNEQSVDPAINILADDTSIEVASEGGLCRINYELVGANPKLEILPTTDAEWITRLTVIPDFITFYVEPNTNLLEDRTAKIEITYGTDVKTVEVKQLRSVKAIDEEFVAKALNGEYADDKFEGYNYFVILSENGTTGWFDLYVDTYYRLDIYAAEPHIGDGPVQVPVGTYVYDMFSLGEPGTFTASASARLQPHSDGTYSENFFSDGVIVVTETGIEAILVLDNGKVHHVVYEGSRELGYMPIPEPDYYSSLTADYIFEHNGGTMRALYYGDDYNNGCGNWIIDVMLSQNPINGDYFRFDIVVDSLDFNMDVIFGEYDAAQTTEEMTPGHYLGGVKGSWMYYVEDDYIVNGSGAPLKTGTIKVEKSSNGIGAMVTFDCVDDLGYKVKGTVACTNIEYYDLRD